MDSKRITLAAFIIIVVIGMIAVFPMGLGPDDDPDPDKMEISQKVWLRESGNNGVDFRIEQILEEDAEMIQIYNHEKENMYVMQFGEWIYDDVTLEELKEMGLAEMIREYEDIAKNYDEGESFGETIEWEIQSIVINEEIDDSKFIPPENITISPFQEQPDNEDIPDNELHPGDPIDMQFESLHITISTEVEVDPEPQEEPIP